MPTNPYVSTHSNDTQYYQPYKRSRWRYCQRASCGKQVKEHELKDKLVKLRDDDTGKLNKMWLKVCPECFNKEE